MTSRTLTALRVAGKDVARVLVHGRTWTPAEHKPHLSVAPLHIFLSIEVNNNTAQTTVTSNTAWKAE